jgi:hypothetical protein
VNAKLKLTGLAKAECTTVSDGSFTVSALPPGEYKLTTTADRKTTAYTQAIDLAPGTPVAIVTLSGQGKIAVTAQQGTGATGGEALSSQTVIYLLVSGRDFSILLHMQAFILEPRWRDGF